MRIRRILLVPIAAVIFAGGVATGAETAPDASQKARYQKLSESLVAPCCWSESLARHRSPQALQARDELAALILQNKSDQEIRDDFVARYGARVLIEPSGSRARWLYVLPFLALLAGVAAVIRFLRARARLSAEASAQPSGRPRQAATTAPAAVDDSEWDW
jgi:cytochrome c-type biogenesis protein CcmH